MNISKTAVVYGGAEIRSAHRITIGEHSIVGHPAILDGRHGLRTAAAQQL